MNTRPNLFDYATSELSQDAFLAWLLKWADDEYKTVSPALHNTGKDFLKSLYEQSGVDFPETCSLEIIQQDKHIDVLCVVNEKTVIVIEDKIGTVEHSNQLERYKALIKSRDVTYDETIFVYVQTGEQSNYKYVEEIGYNVVLRKDLLAIFENSNGMEAMEGSDILGDYAKRVRRIEDDVMSYQTEDISKWSPNAWKGFYNAVKRELRDGTWEYIANQSGGFFGFWWYFRDVENVRVYLQLEQQKFCFKIAMEGEEDKAQRKEVQTNWSRKIMEAVEENGLKGKCFNLRLGTYMTVATLDGEYRIINSDGKLDMDKTIAILKQAQSVIDICVQNG